MYKPDALKAAMIYYLNHNGVDVESIISDASDATSTRKSKRRRVLQGGEESKAKRSESIRNIYEDICRNGLPSVQIPEPSVRSLKYDNNRESDICKPEAS